jgi:hypothetical protein
MARRFYEGGPLGQLPTPEEAFESMLYGRPTPDESNAYHEAGHAGAAVAFDIGFSFVSILPDGQNWGGLVTEGTEGLLQKLAPGGEANNSDQRRFFESLIVLALAGEASEALLWERDFDITRPGLLADLRFALALAERIHTDSRDREVLIRDMADRACRFVREPLREHQISYLAQRLRLARVLERPQVVQIMDEMAAAFPSQ